MRLGNLGEIAALPCDFQKLAGSLPLLLFHLADAIPSIAFLRANLARLRRLPLVETSGRIESGDVPCIGDGDEMYASSLPRDMNSAASCREDLAACGNERSS